MLLLYLSVDVRRVQRDVTSRLVKHEISESDKIYDTLSGDPGKSL